MRYEGMKTTYAGEIGECKGGPPVADFKWPRTTAADTCAHHRPTAAKVVMATVKKPAEPAELFDAGRAAAPAGVLAYDAAAPSTAQAARLASDQSQRKPKTK